MIFYADLRISLDAESDRPGHYIDLSIAFEAIDFATTVALVNAFACGISAASTLECYTHAVYRMKVRGRNYLGLAGEELWEAIDRLVDPGAYDTSMPEPRQAMTLMEYAKRTETE